MAISAASIIAYATQTSKTDVPGIQDQVVGRVIGRLAENQDICSATDWNGLGDSTTGI